MLWSLSIISVRKEENKSVLNVPLGFSRHQELINDNLSSISEISKLSLPESECVWMSLGVSELVSHNGKFREMGVGGDEFSDSLLLVLVGDNLVDWVVVTILVLIENVSMPVREGSSLDILT